MNCRGLDRTAGCQWGGKIHSGRKLLNGTFTIHRFGKFTQIKIKAQNSTSLSICTIRKPKAFTPLIIHRFHGFSRINPKLRVFKSMYSADQKLLAYIHPKLAKNPRDTVKAKL
jgi:hypothetical protein